ncbi:MAG TPA: hypothetical protein VHZ07_22065 [Bryobacteraceae bacterium]|jgi:hypothetical protein|nr:hypothetical protein [Bryobacteraceae bacterium]
MHLTENEKAEMLDYEDTLIVFVIRLLQLKGMKYRRKSALSELRIEDVSITSIDFGAASDPDQLVRFLSVVRQFWMPKEAIHVAKIAHILIGIAQKLPDTEMEERVKKLGRLFRDQNKSSYSLAFPEHTVNFSIDRLVDFWLNTYYFHTDLKQLETAASIMNNDFIRQFTLRHVESYLEDFIGYVGRLGNEALSIMWKNVLPEGKLHYLLISHTYEEIAPLLAI